MNLRYRPMQQQMVFKNSQLEHLLFEKMGLSVPTEAQAAFFSVLVLLQVFEMNSDDPARTLAYSCLKIRPACRGILLIKKAPK